MNPSILEIKEFVDLLDQDAEMQELVRMANTPGQIVALAESAGIKISVKHLRFWSRELTASYFPWAEKGNQWRREFFEEIHGE